jgi:hypothetical protein
LAKAMTIALPISRLAPVTIAILFFSFMSVPVAFLLLPDLLPYGEKYSKSSEAPLHKREANGGFPWFGVDDAAMKDTLDRMGPPICLRRGGHLSSLQFPFS